MEAGVIMRWLQLILLVSVTMVSTGAVAQKQLVLLKKQKVILRLRYGDDVSVKLKGKKDRVDSYVNNLFDTAILAHKTIIPFSQIDRVYFVRGTFANVIGGAMVVGGAGYFLIDQLNEIVVQGNDASIDDRVATTSIGLVAVGLPLMVIRKKSTKIGGKFRLLSVQPGSPFYQRDLQHMDFDGR